MCKYNAKTGNTVALLDHKGETPHTGFVAKPSQSVAHAKPDQTNLEAGGDKGNNSAKRYCFKQHAFDSLVTWLLLGWKWKNCRHTVFTIPEDEYYHQCQGLTQHETEKHWQRLFTNCLKLLRHYNQLGEYCWVKEYQPQTGAIHWHFLHHGFIDYRFVNKVWSNQIRASKGEPVYKNCFRHKKGFDHLKDQDPDNIARYFGKYFQEGKGDKFYTKAYRLPPLPDKITGGKIKLGQTDFEKVKGDQVAEMEYATTYRTDLNQFARLINRFTGYRTGPPDFSKYSGGLTKTNQTPQNPYKNHVYKRTPLACHLYTTLNTIGKPLEYVRQGKSIRFKEHRGRGKEGERGRPPKKLDYQRSGSLLIKGSTVRSFRKSKNDPERLCSYTDLQVCRRRAERPRTDRGAGKRIPEPDREPEKAVQIGGEPT